MKLATAIVVLLALVLPASAEAVTIDSPNPVYQRWADESRVPTPSGTITVDATGCPGKIVLGCTNGTIIWLQSWVGRSDFLHELGHAFAFQHPVLPNTEEFADSYSVCARVPAHRMHLHRMGFSIGEGVAGWRAVQTTCQQIRASSDR